MSGCIKSTPGNLPRRQPLLAAPVEPTRAVAEIDADPTDNRVLEAAAEAEADAVVSGDRHLLALGAWRGIAIQTPVGGTWRCANHLSLGAAPPLPRVTDR